MGKNPSSSLEFGLPSLLIFPSCAPLKLALCHFSVPPGDVNADEKTNPWSLVLWGAPQWVGPVSESLELLGNLQCGVLY